MMLTKPLPDELLAKAADLLAPGASWEAVALDLGERVETVRRWSDDFPELWRRRHDHASRIVLSECLAEACLTLRNHLRPKNSIRDQREAAGWLIRLALGMYRHRPRVDKARRAPDPANPLDEMNLDELESFVRNFRPDLLDDEATDRDDDSGDDAAGPTPERDPPSDGGGGGSVRGSRRSEPLSWNWA